MQYKQQDMTTVVLFISDAVKHLQQSKLMTLSELVLNFGMTILEGSLVLKVHLIAFQRYCYYI
jgi:hypothetical protein